MAWVRISSEPKFFVLVNFSSIGKIAAHLRGSCLYLIFNPQVKRNLFHHKISLRFDYKMFLNVLLYALRKTFEGQWPEYNWSKCLRAMERPIKVNRYKSGGVDIYFCSTVGSNVLGGLVSNPVRAWILLSLLFCCW